MELPEDYLEQFRAAYPKRAGDNGWNAVRGLIPKRIEDGFTWSRIIAGVRAYAVHCRQTGKIGTELVKQARTFVGPDAWFDEWADMDVRTPQEVQEDAKWSQLEGRAKAVNVSLDRSRGYDWSQDIVQKAERDALNKRWEASGMNAPKFAVVK